MFQEVQQPVFNAIEPSRPFTVASMGAVSMDVDPVAMSPRGSGPALAGTDAPPDVVEQGGIPAPPTRPVPGYTPAVESTAGDAAQPLSPPAAMSPQVGGDGSAVLPPGASPPPAEPPQPQVAEGVIDPKASTIPPPAVMSPQVWGDRSDT